MPKEKKKILPSLHGFHSSPFSLKSRQMNDYLACHHPEITFICPQLPCLPSDMWATVQGVFEKNKGTEIALMGSSLGGF